MEKENELWDEFLSKLEGLGYSFNSMAVSSIWNAVLSQLEFDAFASAAIFACVEQTKGRQARTLEDGVPPLLQVTSLSPPSIPKPELGPPAGASARERVWGKNANRGISKSCSELVSLLNGTSTVPSLNPSTNAGSQWLVLQICQTNTLSSPVRLTQKREFLLLFSPRSKIAM